MNVIKKYLFVAWIAARSNLAYFGELASRLIFLGIILFIFLRLWQTTYGESGVTVLGGLSLNQMLWYLTVTEAIALSAPRVAQNVDVDVRTGALALQLIRPMSYPLYCLFSNLGERLLRFFLNLSVGAVIAYLLVGPIELDFAGWLIFCSAIPLAFVLDFLANFLIGLGAFWIEDTGGILLIYTRVTMILGGMMIPLELFPTWLIPLLRFLPFSSVIYGPAHLLVHPDLAELAALLVRQMLGIFAFGLVVYLTYRTAVKRVFVNGG